MTTGSGTTPTGRWGAGWQTKPLLVVNCCAADLTPAPGTGRADRLGANVAFTPFGNLWQPDRCCPRQDQPPVAAALTASAAAVNPAMGLFSAKMSGLLSFALFAVNARLGLWFTAGPRTEAGRETSRWKKNLNEALGVIGLPAGPHKPADVHVSDGGHFDNLAAYEMIRRRCRYVVICDGGADPNVTFGELANLQELVRRDFGVELEIDLDPLRLDENRRSQRHVAVGVIQYPPAETSPASGRGGPASGRFSEDGILVYVKPTLTGDEPEDVTKYQSLSPTFPHESTSDQFFDGFQWEVYRKLGEHSITEEFGFAKHYPEHAKENAVRIFDVARPRAPVRQLRRHRVPAEHGRAVRLACERGTR